MWQLAIFNSNNFSNNNNNNSMRNNDFYAKKRQQIPKAFMADAQQNSNTTILYNTYHKYETLDIAIKCDDISKGTPKHLLLTPKCTLLTLGKI